MVQSRESFTPRTDSHANSVSHKICLYSCEITAFARTLSCVIFCFGRQLPGTLCPWTIWPCHRSEEIMHIAILLDQGIDCRCGASSGTGLCFCETCRRAGAQQTLGPLTISLLSFSLPPLCSRKMRRRKRRRRRRKEEAMRLRMRSLTRACWTGGPSILLPLRP